MNWHNLADYVIDSRINDTPLKDSESLSLAAYFNAAKLNCLPNSWIGEVFNCISAYLSQTPMLPSVMVQSLSDSESVFCLSRALLLGKSYSDLEISELIDTCFMYLASSEYDNALCSLLSVCALDSQRTQSILTPTESRAIDQAKKFLEVVFETTSDGSTNTELTWIRKLEK